MKQSDNTAPEAAARRLHPDVRVAVENFGPIEKGDIDLRPLTVFIGPSNTGKTYFAVLIYALHRVLKGFHRFPIQGNYPFLLDDDFNISNDEFLGLVLKLMSDGGSFHFSDLPKSLTKSIRSASDNPNLLQKELINELCRCFNADSFDALSRTTRSPVETKISLIIKEEERNLWQFSIKGFNKACESNGRIEDIEIFPNSQDMNGDRQEEIMQLFFQILVNGRPGDTAKESINRIKTIVGLLSNSTPSKIQEQYYLPASRSGIMLCHRNIATTLISRSSEAESFPEFPGIMADFLRHLALQEDPTSQMGVPEQEVQEKPADDLADYLEREMLGGRIEANRSHSHGYPHFTYRFHGADRGLRLNMASSMVSELAPIVLFLRNCVVKNDMLVIEEPEAHLHPAAQTELATLLVKLIHRGIRVLSTTHSEWLLQALGNLMLEGKIEEKSRKKDAKFRSPLRPQDIGIWLFDKDDGDQATVVKEVNLDPYRGIETPDYENVSEALYGRTAALQNLLESLDDDFEEE